MTSVSPQAAQCRGGAGIDTLDGGPGDNIALDLAANPVRSATTVGNDWLTTHASTVNGKTVLKVGGEKRTLPHANLAQLAHSTTTS